MTKRRRTPQKRQATTALREAAFVQEYPHSASSELNRLRNLYERPLQT